MLIALLRLTVVRSVANCVALLFAVVVRFYSLVSGDSEYRIGADDDSATILYAIYAFNTLLRNRISVELHRLAFCGSALLQVKFDVEPATPGDYTASTYDDTSPPPLVVAADAAVVYRRSAAAPRFVTLALRALLSTAPIIATRLPLLDNCTHLIIYLNLNIFKCI